MFILIVVIVFIADVVNIVVEVEVVEDVLVEIQVTVCLFGKMKLLYVACVI